MPAARPALPMPRELHKRLTRAAILRAARELFTERGFTDVTVADIAEHAGITPRTLFRYFDNKAALVLHNYRELMSQMIDAMSRRPIHEPPMVAMCEGIIDFAKRRPDSMFIAVGPLWETDHLPDSERGVLVFDVVDQAAQMLVDRYKLFGPEHRLRVRVWARTGLGAMSCALGEAGLRTRTVDDLPPTSLGDLLRQAFAALGGHL